MTEIWKPIPGFEGAYEVSNIGRVRSLDRMVEFADGRIQKYKERTRKLTPNTSGYLQIALWTGNYRTQAVVHRLVLEAFGGSPAADHECNHIDGDKLNNRIGNLEWVTRSENMIHAFRNGLKSGMVGEANGQAKLTAKQVEEIHQLYATGDYYQREIGTMFGVHQTTISDIVIGKGWKGQVVTE